MNLSVTANSKQFATAPSVEHHWGMKAGSNPLHEDWILNRQCDRVDDQECDRYHPMTKTKRFDPFVFFIDLNPVAAGLAKAPECSPNTSVKQRVDHVKQQGRTEDLAKALEGSVAGSKASSKLELDLWLIPIEDRRGQGEARDGMLDGFSLGSYLMLVEYTGRLLRTGKAKIGSELSDVFARLGCSAERWQMRMNKLSGGRMLGRYFAGKRERLREAAEKLGVHHLANLAGCAAT